MARNFQSAAPVSSRQRNKATSGSTREPTWQNQRLPQRSEPQPLKGKINLTLGQAEATIRKATVYLAPDGRRWSSGSLI
jgi:hypothetical protein